MGETRERRICSTLRDKIFEFSGVKRETISCPKDCNLRAMIQIFIGRKSHCTLCWMGSESTTRPLSLYSPLSCSIYPCMRLHHTFTVSSFLSLSRSPPAMRKNAAGKREGGRGRAGTEGGEGTEREGLGIASCIGEHKRSRNNTIGRRASTVSHACTHFSCADSRGSPSRRTRCAPVLEGKGHRRVRARSRSSKCACTRGATRSGAAQSPSRYERERASYFYMYGAHRTRDVCASRKSRRAGEGRLEGRPFFTEWGNSRYEVRGLT